MTEIDTALIFRVICGLVILIMLIYYLKRKRRFASFVFGAFTGFAALVLLNRYGGLIGAEIPLNAFNTAGSLVLGVPFVVCLTILKFIL